MLSFFQNLIGVKTDQAVNSAIQSIVSFDPKSATEAELRGMEQNLDQIGRQVAEARQTYDKEKREADAIQTLSQQRMAAAEQLQDRMTTETDPSRKAELERSLATLVGMLESMSSDLDREKQDAEDARAFLDSLQETYNQAGQKLKSARDELARAERDMGRAEQQKEIAQRRAESARQAAGLSQATSGLSVALKAMQENASRSMAEAETANAKARLLTPTRPERDDPNIAQAMAQVQGRLPAPSNNLTDRLASLRQKQIGGPAKQLPGPTNA